VCVFGLSWLCACIVPRVSCAWPLEWMEGAVLEHALRLLHGRALYAAPSGEFIPFVYPPLSYLPIAVTSAWFGPELWAARLPSLLALALSLWFIARAAAHLAGEWSAGALAAGLYALGYGYSGGFLDLARVDAMFMLLVVIGAERMARGRTDSALLWFALSCLAKQHGVFFLLAASCYAWAERGVGPARVLFAWGLLGAVVIALEWHSRGWFSVYTYSVPRKHGLAPALLLSFIAVDLGVYLPVLLGLAGVSIARRRGGALRGCDALLFAAVLASALGRAHPGGDDNVRLPAYALLCLLGAVGHHLLTGHASRLRQACSSAGVVLQVAVLWQPPSLYHPTVRTGRAFAALQAALTRCAQGGPSVALDHTRLTGVPFAHMLALSDLVRNRDALGLQAANAVAGALAAETAPNAVAVSGLFPALRYVIERQYEPCATLPAFSLPSGFAPAATRVYRRVR
jgi:hypothetical protein